MNYYSLLIQSRNGVKKRMIERLSSRVCLLSSNNTFNNNNNSNNNNNNNNRKKSSQTTQTTKRVVLGFKPSKIASSQGAAYTAGKWKLRDSNETNVWENALQGYISCGNEEKVPRTLEFDTKEAMEEFCKKQGWTLEVVEKKEREHFTQRGSSVIPGAGKIGKNPKAYGDNFSVQRKGLPIWPNN